MFDRREFLTGGAATAAALSIRSGAQADENPTFVDTAGGAPAPVLDGRSFLPVLRGETDHHKDYVYGLMTTRGIINGSDCFPIRTVRDKGFRLIWNPSHETKFTNACTSHVTFQSMLEAAKAGDDQARRVTQRYQVRPEWELYDVNRDPLEQTNLYGDPDNAESVASLKEALQKWMASQGDKGIETELDAGNHQARNRKKKAGSRGKK